MIKYVIYYLNSSPAQPLQQELQQKGNKKIKERNVIRNCLSNLKTNKTKVKAHSSYCLPSRPYYKHTMGVNPLLSRIGILTILSNIIRKTLDSQIVATETYLTHTGLSAFAYRNCNEQLKTT